MGRKTRKLIKKLIKSRKLIKTRKTRKTRRTKKINKLRKTYKMRGGVDFSTIKISAKPALNIATKTTSCFLNQLFQPSTQYKNASDVLIKDNYDTFEITKYGFGSYENMIASLEVFIKKNINFKDTILDVVLQYVKNKKTKKSSKLPAILEIITDLKIVSSDLAYFFTKDPRKILNTSVVELIPSTIKPYIDTGIIGTDKGSYNRPLETVLKEIISPLINPAHINPTQSSIGRTSARRSSHKKSKRDIIDQIKSFIMKSDYSAEVENGWYLSTILLELVTNILINLDLTNSSELQMNLIQLNNEQIITCELLNYLILNKSENLINENKDINFNFGELYDSMRIIPTSATHAPTADADYDIINEFTILDFFLEKNTTGILPPFILLLISCRINPAINIARGELPTDIDENDIKAMTDFKTMLQTTLKLNTQITNCDTIKPAMTMREKVTSLFTRTNKKTAQAEKAEKASTIEEEAEEGEEAAEEAAEESFHTPRDGEPNEIANEANVANEPLTTCTPNKQPSGFFGTTMASVSGAIINSYINPILKQVCRDLNSNNFSWNTLDGLHGIISDINLVKALLPIKGAIKTNICYSLAPYTTFFPLDITRYISTKFFPKDDKTFMEMMAKYEKNISIAYKDEPTYVKPLCIPIDIMNKVVTNKYVDIEA